MMAARMESRQVLSLSTLGDEKRTIKLSANGDVRLRPTSKYTNVHSTDDITTESQMKEVKSQGPEKHETTRRWNDSRVEEEISIGGAHSNNVCPSDNCRENSELCTSVSVLSRY